jgi:hypothetical protein
MGSATVQAGELIMDYGLYPRVNINAQHVADLADALDTGVKFPPVLADEATRKLIDGFHRTSATIKRRGLEGKIAVEFRRYASEVEMFKDAVRFNTEHGLRLSRFEQVRVMEKGRTLSISEEEMAGLLHMPVDRLGKLEARKTGHSEDGNTVIPLKGTASHLRGCPVTEKQREAIHRAGGMSLTFYANQILNAINGDLVDTQSSAVLEKLVELRDRLTTYLD